MNNPHNEYDTRNYLIQPIMNILIEPITRSLQGRKQVFIDRVWVSNYTPQDFTNMV